MQYKVLPFPMHLQIETTNICNAKCVFCIHDRFTSFETMGDDLFHKIIDDPDCKNLISLSLNMTGETYCDKQMSERIRYVRKTLPKVQIILFTNGFIDYKDIDVLAEVGNVKITVSLNGNTDATRYKLMKLHDFEEVAGKVDYMYSKGIEPVLSIAWFPTLEISEINEFSRLRNSREVRFQNWAGLLYPYKRDVPTNCSRVYEYLTIMRTGQACLCCFDPFGAVDYGNINNMSIGEIWNSKLKQEHIQMHQSRKGESLKLCGKCTEGA